MEEIDEIKDAINDQKEVIKKQKSILKSLKSVADKIVMYYKKGDWKSIVKIAVGVTLVILGYIGYTLI